jgi:two-component system, OmpR family, sensor histidine kinase VicK
VYKGIERIGGLSQDGVFIYNINDRRFEYINDTFAIIFNAGKEKLMKDASLVLPFIRSEDTYHLRYCLQQLQECKTITRTELRLQFDDGTLKHLSFDAYLLDDPKLVTGFVKDCTKEKEHEDYIINYGARKDTLLDMMAHNLSGPLHLSQNMVRWMQERHRETVPEEIISQLQLVQDNTQHCLDIVNDFLKEEHLESERIYVKKTRFDVLDRITVTLDKLITSNKDKQFRLITDLENLNISTDSVKFFQIIHNLVSNAIKFTPPHGQIDILIEETRSTFIIRVRDNGIGIPEEMHGTLFQRRTPAGRSGLNKEKSTGIGLSIVRRLVELLDGKIWFESEENKGSTFSVEFPKD